MRAAKSGTVHAATRRLSLEKTSQLYKLKNCSFIPHVNNYKHSKLVFNFNNDQHDHFLGQPDKLATEQMGQKSIYFKGIKCYNELPTFLKI